MRRSVIWCLALALLGCDDDGGGGEVPELSGEVVTDTFTVGEGDSAVLVGDVVVRASGSITIDGMLACGDGLTGFSVTLEAEGDIVVNGAVRACNGAPSQDGGSVVLRSLGGSITLGESAALASGDGGAGIEGPDTGGRGADGGDVALHATNGTLSVADGASIYIGNGGDGLSIEMNYEGLPEVSFEIDLENGGGDSGSFAMEALTIEGIEYEDLVAEEDYPPDSEDPIIRAGETYRVITAEDHFEGGVGGDAGDFRLDEEVTEPSGAGAVSWVISEEKDDEPVVVVFGDDGGSGREAGGNGETVYVRGRAGTAERTAGQWVVARGGDGGSCANYSLFGLVNAGCRSGSGGSGTARGGRGADVASPRSGGWGGDARAEAGMPGLGGEGVNCGRHGNATADGGDGGNALSSCDSEETPESGGDGGRGGHAIANAPGEGINPFCEGSPHGTARARGGNGGNGGDGLRPGSGGISGMGTAQGGPSSWSEDGEHGTDGERCAEPPGPCPPDEVGDTAEEAEDVVITESEIREELRRLIITNLSRGDHDVYRLIFERDLPPEVVTELQINTMERIGAGTYGARMCGTGEPVEPRSGSVDGDSATYDLDPVNPLCIDFHADVPECSPESPCDPDEECPEVVTVFVVREQDSDDDGVPDSREGALGTDASDPDSDDDGVLDGDEDPDGDGVTTRTEIRAGTDPLDPETTDGTPDGELDTDGDGLTNAEESALGTHPSMEDSDFDGLTDFQEVEIYGTDPLSRDTDEDGLNDKDELDRIPPTSPTNPDTDDDALSDGDEVHRYGTDPSVRDTDDGCVSDGLEVLFHGTDPLDPDDDLAITSEDMLEGFTHTPYSFTFDAEGGYEELGLTWSAVSVPFGSVSPDGTFSGTPTEAGTFEVTVRVDSGGCTREATFELVIYPLLVSTLGDGVPFDGDGAEDLTTVLEGGVEPFSCRFYTGRGRGTYTGFDVDGCMISGALPEDALPGNYGFIVIVTDDVSQTVDIPVAISNGGCDTATQTLSPGPSPLRVVAAGSAYEWNLTVTDFDWRPLGPDECGGCFNFVVTPHPLVGVDGLDCEPEVEICSPCESCVSAPSDCPDVLVMSRDVLVHTHEPIREGPAWATADLELDYTGDEECGGKHWECHVQVLEH